MGVVPQMVIAKRRDATGPWPARHSTLAAANTLYFDTTAASASAATVWNSTAPTSAVFSIGTSTDTNASGGTYVAYCFAEISGFSRFGSYTGNGAADGPFVYCGFRPRYVLIKCSSAAANNWVIKDTARSPWNIALANLYVNLTDLEDTNTSSLAIDILSNGFKVRGAGAQVNTNTATYIYIAFAENPFGGSNVSPVNAR